MKELNLSNNEGILKLSNNEGILGINQSFQVPFSITFTHKSKWVTVQLVNASDVLKLADIFAEMLNKNGIDYTIISEEK